MSKDRKKLLHIHSSVNDKQPTPATLELGELGVNNAKGNAFISTKNSDGEVVRFSEDETIIGWMEQKEVFPYEGYVRGADSGQVNSVTTEDLVRNKSNIIIKLNQVVPEGTDYSPYDEKVNGAKDIYGNPISPISSGGYKDGAGLAIDMSRYAMIDANPSFSSVTTTCHATFNGTTEVKGKDDDCGSLFTVDVANACVDASDTLNEYGANHANFGTSCDGTKISNDTTLKGKKVLIESPSGDLTVDIQACEHISNKTNDFIVTKCQGANDGKVEIDTDTTTIKSCDGISAITKDFQVKECEPNGKAGISSTTINNSANTIDEKACEHINQVTDSFNIEQCGNSGETKIHSCKGVSSITDNFIVEQCNSGTTRIHSCKEITLESKNITLTDGDCGSGQTTIEVSDLCLVGERKTSLYGDETNVGLDCECNGSTGTIATNTRVFGKGTLITTDNDCSDYAASGNVETKAGNDIIETAVGNINENTTNGNINENTTNGNINETTTNGNINESAVNGNINENAKNINNTASNNICDTAANEATFYGAVKTNVGINCDDTATATATTVKGGKVIVDASATNLGLTAKQDILESAERDITITANDDICETAGDEATFYGVNLTRLGITCDGAVKTTQLEIGGDDVCADANDRASFYGANKSDLGINCAEDDRALLTRVSGDTVNVGGDDITVYADDVLCESGRTVTIFAGEGGKLTIGGNACSGNTRGSYPIVYVRRADDVDCGISADTVDGALHEVFERSKINLITSTAHTSSTDSYTVYSIHQDLGDCERTVDFSVGDTIVSMSAMTYSPESELLKKYTLWQTIGDRRIDIGEINIPKDHILRDVSIVNGHLNGDTFTPCPAGDNTCSWYIKLVWNVFDPSTGHADDKITYLPADDFVKDYEFHDSPAIDFTQWYDGQKNHVSADTTVKIMSNNGLSARTFNKENAVHTLSSYTLNSVSGDVKTNVSATTWAYDPFDKKVTITAATDASHINRKTVSWRYGDVKSASGASYDPGDGTVNTFGGERTMEFVIPQSVDNIKRGKLTISHCNSTEEYDPGVESGTTINLTHGELSIKYGEDVTSAENTSYSACGYTEITIPTHVSHIGRGKLTYIHNGFSGTSDPATDTAFTSPHSALTINYGPTCNDDNAVNKTYDTSEAKTIVIPKTISDITGGAIKLNECSGNCITVSGDICSTSTIKAKAFYSSSDKNLKENINSILYNDYHRAANVSFKSFNFKDDETKKKTYGVIAQDVQGVGLDHIVHRDEKGNLSVDYISFLILRIADLENTVKELSNEINNLKGENK